jgi:hypothetical protein
MPPETTIIEFTPRTLDGVAMLTIVVLIGCGLGIWWGMFGASIASRRQVTLWQMLMLPAVVGVVSRVGQLIV